MAPHAKYWHLKNLRRTFVPGEDFALFHQTPLPDGEIDYRFAVSAMLAAGYTGDYAIEGLRLGDAITVKLVEAAPVAGALRFEILSEGRYEVGAKRHAGRRRVERPKSRPKRAGRRR